MNFFKYLIIVTIGILATPASAKLNFNSIDVSVRSYHFADRCYDSCEKKFKEDNYGIALVYGNHRTQLVLGTLRNSFDKQSNYGGLNFTTNIKKSNGFYWRPGLMLGAADGYKDTPLRIDNENSGIVPIISPNVSVYYGRVHLNLGILPSANTAVGIMRVGLRF